MIYIKINFKIFKKKSFCKWKIEPSDSFLFLIIMLPYNKQEHSVNLQCPENWVPHADMCPL